MAGGRECGGADWKSVGTQLKDIGTLPNVLHFVATDAMLPTSPPMFRISGLPGLSAELRGDGIIVGSGSAAQWAQA